MAEQAIKKIDPEVIASEKAHYQMDKLVAAFLGVAEDLIITGRADEIKKSLLADQAPYNASST